MRGANGLELMDCNIGMGVFVCMSCINTNRPTAMSSEVFFCQNGQKLCQKCLPQSQITRTVGQPAQHATSKKEREKNEMKKKGD